MAVQRRSLCPVGAVVFFCPLDEVEEQGLDIFTLVVSLLFFGPPFFVCPTRRVTGNVDNLTPSTNP